MTDFTTSNPLCWLDIRSRLRERRLWILALAMTAIPLAISMLALAGSSSRAPFPANGMMLAGIAVFSHGALLAILSSLGAAQRISQERERRTLAALVNSPLSPSRIADGKLLGAWLFTLWISTITLPFLAVASLWGGLSIAELFCCWALNVAAAFATASLALGLSGLFGRSLSAYLATGTALFLWCAISPVVGGLCEATSGNLPHLLRDVAYPALFFYHLPLAPQVCIFSGYLQKHGLLESAAPFASALTVWSAMALLGRHLAIRGLRREVR